MVGVCVVDHAGLRGRGVVVEIIVQKTNVFVSNISDNLVMSILY